MTKKMTAVEKKLEELLKNTNLSDLDFLGFDNASDLIENMQTQIDEDGVIYYSNAMEYLKENDASLTQSLEIAQEYGYSLKDLNSEKLATILKQRNLSEELQGLNSQIEDCFEE